VAASILDKITSMKRTKVKGSGRKIGSENIIQRELREQLRMHLVNELNAIQGRIDELPLSDRYKVAAMLFKLVVSPQSNEMQSESPIILVPTIL
jgi:hypothetical protein